MAVGTYPLRLPSDLSLILRNCYFVPGASRNLISISSLAQDNYVFNFNKDYCTIYLKNKMVGCDFLIDNLYHLHIDIFVNVTEQEVNAIGFKRPRDETNLSICGNLSLII